MFLFIVDALLVLLFARLITDLLVPENPTPFIISLFIVAYAEVVLVTELASLLSAIRPITFLVCHAILAGLAFGIRVRHRPQRIRRVSFEIRSWLHHLSTLSKTHPPLLLLCVVVVAIYLFGAFLILNVPPNNSDAMSYHLARVGYWQQNASLSPWPTHDLRRTTFPPNAEISILWSVTFLKDARFAGLVQWTAALIAGLAIFGLARQFGYSLVQSGFAVLIWASFPEILLQSTSTQNDLVVSAFFISSIYFLYVGVQSKQNTLLLLSGAALGLALGTKSTVLFMLPGLGITLLLFIATRSILGHIRLWLFASLVGFLLFGSFIFFSNLLTYGHPLGGASSVENVTQSSVPRATLLVTNAARYSYQMLDLTGLPDFIAQPLLNLKATVARSVFRALNIPVESTNTIAFRDQPFTLELDRGVHEDIAWFGLLGFLIFIPAFTYQTYVGIRDRDPYRLGLSGSGKTRGYGKVGT